MRSLTDLNTSSAQQLEFTDNRDANVIWVKVNDTEIAHNTTENIFPVRIAYEIKEVIQPDTTAIVYTIDIPLQFTLVWNTVPSGVTITREGNIYKVRGISSAADWAVVKKPDVYAPGGYAGLISYRCTIEYNSVAGQNTLFWEVRTQALFATIFPEFTMNIDATNLKPLSTTLNAVSNMSVYIEEVSMSSTVDFESDIEKIGIYQIDYTLNNIEGRVIGINDFSFFTLETNFDEFLIVQDYHIKQYTFNGSLLESWLNISQPQIQSILVERISNDYFVTNDEYLLSNQYYAQRDQQGSITVYDYNDNIINSFGSQYFDIEAMYNNYLILSYERFLYLYDVTQATEIAIYTRSLDYSSIPNVEINEKFIAIYLNHVNNNLDKIQIFNLNFDLLKEYQPTANQQFKFNDELLIGKIGNGVVEIWSRNGYPTKIQNLVINASVSANVGTVYQLAANVTISSSLDVEAQIIPSITVNQTINTSSGSHVDYEFGHQGQFAVYENMLGYGNISVNSNSGQAEFIDLDTQNTLFTLTNPNAYNTIVGDHFGSYVGITDQFIIVGAKFEDPPEGNRHTFYVYNKLGNYQGVLPSDATSTVDFGKSVTVTGSYLIANDTQRRRLVFYDLGTRTFIQYIGESNIPNFGTFIESSGNNLVAYSPGVIKVYDVTTRQEIQSISISHGCNSLSVNGDTISIGDTTYESPITNQGAVFHYSITSGALLYTTTDPVIAENTRYGQAVARSSQRTVETAINSYNNTQGIAYVRNGVNGEITHTLGNPNDYEDGYNFGDYFGYFAKISDNYIVISAPNEDSQFATNNGRLYVYKIG